MDGCYHTTWYQKNKLSESDLLSFRCYYYIKLLSFFKSPVGQGLCCPEASRFNATYVPYLAMTLCERGPEPKHEFDWLSCCRSQIWIFFTKQSQIKAYVKVKTADEMEAEELLFSQASDVEEEAIVPFASPPPQANKHPRAKH